jgi:hypothetical protein
VVITTRGKLVNTIQDFLENTDNNTGILIRHKGIGMLKKKGKKNIVEKARQEIIFAIKERINEIAGGVCNVPVTLTDVEIKEPDAEVTGAVKYLNIHNIYIDDGGCLCGDLVGKDDHFNHDIIFGKSIEDLNVDDLKDLLDNLYGDDWAVKKDESEYPEIPVGMGAPLNEQFRKYIQRSRIFSRILQL